MSQIGDTFAVDDLAEEPVVPGRCVTQDHGECEVAEVYHRRIIVLRYGEVLTGFRGKRSRGDKKRPRAHL
jgi:hypothetical protein